MGVADTQRPSYPLEMLTTRARSLRKEMTPAEIKLWSVLRGRQISGHRFRRQHPFERYIIDFICLEKRVVIEVDGAQHFEPEALEYDAQRTRWLQSNGYVVVRFSNIEVFTKFEGVLMAIADSVAVRPVVPRSVRSKRSPPPVRA